MLFFDVLNVKNVTKHTDLGDQIILANNPLLRLKGLLGYRELPSSHGLWLTPCNSIHMFFMHISLDVIFLDKNQMVIDYLENFKPWHISKIYKSAKHVLELPVGMITATHTTIGDKVEGTIQKRV